MTPLHSTALSFRSRAPPHHPHYLHHNATRTIQLDLLLKVGQVLKTLVKTPILNLKVLITGDLLLKTGHVMKTPVRSPMLNLKVLNMGRRLLKVGQMLKTP